MVDQAPSASAQIVQNNKLGSQGPSLTSKPLSISLSAAVLSMVLRSLLLALLDALLSGLLGGKGGQRTKVEAMGRDSCSTFPSPGRRSCSNEASTIRFCKKVTKFKFESCTK